MKITASPLITPRWDIQALRGLAVLWVLLHHAQLPFVPAGYLGVDIFFVVSGFLITGLVSRGIEAGNFRLRDFYWRRAKRLLPAAYLTLLLTTLAAPYVLDRPELLDFGAQLRGALGLVSNLVLWRQSGYFEGAAEHKPLLHFWSLSIEEQYYLLLPTLLLLCTKRWRAGLLLGLTVVSAAFCAWLVQRYASAAFYLLPSRAWELGLGSLGALLPERYWPRPSRCLLGAAVAALLLLPLFPPSPLHPGPSAWLIDLATLCVLLRHPSVRKPRLLTPLVGLGNISYSLYLIHWPLLAFINNAWVGDAAQAGSALMSWRLGALALAVGLAAAMYRWVEAPVRHWQRPPDWRALVGVLIASGALAWLPSLLFRPPTTGPDYALLRQPNHGLSAACDFERPFNGAAACVSGTPHWLVWGDSFAMHLVPGLANVGPGLAQATKSSCGPFANLAPLSPKRMAGDTFATPWVSQCKDFNDSVLAWLAQSPKTEVVVFSSILQQYLDPRLYRLRHWDADGRTHDEDVSVDALLAAARATVAQVRAQGKRVLWIAPPPSADFDIGACAERTQAGRFTLGAPPSCQIDRAAYERRRAAALEFLRRLEQEADVPVLRLDPALCNVSTCRTEWDGVLLYRDAGHLSIDGSRLLAQRLDWAHEIERLAR